MFWAEQYLNSTTSPTLSLSEATQCEQAGGSMTTQEKPVGLTIDKFIRNFQQCTGWKCESGARITKELTEFATERLGSTRNMDELHGLFCMLKGIQPYRI